MGERPPTITITRRQGGRHTRHGKLRYIRHGVNEAQEIKAQIKNAIEFN